MSEHLSACRLGELDRVWVDGAEDGERELFVAERVRDRAGEHRSGRLQVTLVDVRDEDGKERAGVRDQPVIWLWI